MTERRIVPPRDRAHAYHPSDDYEPLDERRGSVWYETFVRPREDQRSVWQKTMQPRETRR